MLCAVVLFPIHILPLHSSRAFESFQSLALAPLIALPFMDTSQLSQESERKSIGSTLYAISFVTIHPVDFDLLLLASSLVPGLGAE